MASPTPEALAAIGARAAAAAQVFTEDPSHPVLSDEDRHHLGRVLRLRDGEEVVVSDGAGHWARTSWVDGGELTPLAGAAGPGGDGSVQFEALTGPALTVAFAPTKGDRPEWVVQKLTELGVDRIVPIRTARSVVRWEGDEREERATAKLARVAREAAAQCRRTWLPEVGAVTTLDGLASASGPAPRLTCPGGRSPSLDHPVVAVGPEGGWDPDELARFGEGVGLGPTVLRAETAAVAVGTLLCALRGGLIASLA